MFEDSFLSKIILTICQIEFFFLLEFSENPPNCPESVQEYVHHELKKKIKAGWSMHLFIHWKAVELEIGSITQMWCCRGPFKQKGYYISRDPITKGVLHMISVIVKIVEHSMGKTKNLSAFKCDQMVGGHQIGHPISKPCKCRDFHGPLCQGCIVSTSILVKLFLPWITALVKQDYPQLSRIVKADRWATVQQIARQFNTGAQQHVSSHIIQNHFLTMGMGYRNHLTMRYLC